MSGNSQLLISEVLKQQKLERAPELSDADYFERFCAEQILKNFGLSYDEIEEGIVDGEHDGGIDSVYCFVGGELVREDFDASRFKKDVHIELHIIQSKSANGFNENELNKLTSVSRNMLSLGADYTTLSQYNPDLKDAMDLFRNAYRALAAKFPTLEISFHYACKNADDRIHPNIDIKASDLKEVVKELFEESEVNVNLLKASDLLAMARRRPLTTYELKFKKSLSAESGHIVLCSLSDFRAFLFGNGPTLRSELFESNVRDFQGSTEVNSEIAATLKDERVVDFWTMNNGVTILASRASITGEQVNIESPQIVNGLQTSTQIASYFMTHGERDDRLVLVKVISSENEESRDKIIRATNSQNGVQPATLKAMDKIQRDIEDTLKKDGLFYDRRKNQYKNAGKPASKIISIPLMAQAVMSTILQRPDSARARPSTLIKDDADYKKVFSEGYPIALYSVSGHLIKAIEERLKVYPNLVARDRNNLKFYVLFCVVCSYARSITPSAAKVATINVQGVSSGFIDSMISYVKGMYDLEGATDQLAKGPELKRLVSAGLVASFSTSS